MSDQQCLKEALRPLKDSSREAVANALSPGLDDIKSYLHLERDIETELETILVDASKSASAQLVLVCGNVGDGKSHLLSFLRNIVPDLHSQFTVHNDATASSKPNRTFLDELRELLAPFSDDAPGEGTEKVVLATNLGTLSNFLASEEGNSFSRLRAYVENKGILDAGVASGVAFDPGSPFQHVSFCDHHLFELFPGGPRSDAIDTAIKQVVKEAPDNPFHKAYLAHVECHPPNCPVRFNYELLRREDVRHRIAGLLIECMVKAHFILSIRALYNFIYDLIVPVEVEPLDCATEACLVERLSPESFLNITLPNRLFGHPALSEVFEQMAGLDPAAKRTEELDQFAIRLCSSDSPSRVLQEQFADGALAGLHAEAFRGLTPESESEQAQVTTAVRLINFFGGTTPGPAEQVYADFLALLRGWFSGEVKALKPVYRLVTGALSKWRGAAPEGAVNIEIGRLQLAYRISEAVALEPRPPPAPALAHHPDRPTTHFGLVLPLLFQVGTDEFALDVDYGLYELLRRIAAGYCPTWLDRADHATFDRFAHDIAAAGGSGSEVLITESKYDHRFRLTIDAFGDYCFTEVVP